MKMIACPNCEKASEWTDKNPWRPFCCERCKMIDLGDWFEERHVIPEDLARSQEEPDT